MSFSGLIVPICFAAAQLAAAQTVAPRGYSFVGPFPMGKTEFGASINLKPRLPSVRVMTQQRATHRCSADVDGDPLREHGGAELLYAKHRQQQKQRFLSELVR